MDYTSDGRAIVSTISRNGCGTVTFRAENVRYERTGLHAKVAIYHNNVLLENDVFNVERSRDRRDLVLAAQRMFGKKNSTEYGTELMSADLTRFCDGLEAEWQKRMPLTTITAGIDDVPPTPPPFLASPILLANQPNLIFGERSSAKSLTAALLATSVLLPWVANPLGLQVNETVTRTIWCDWEWGQADISYHAERLCRGHNLSTIEIFHQPMLGPLSRSVEMLKRLRRQVRADMMIYDSVSMACGVADLNKTEGAIALYDGVREIGGTALLLAHTSKEDTGARKSAFGSQVFESQSRNIWECIKTEPTEDTIEVGLFHRKNPPFCHYHKPIGYRAEFSDHAILITNLDARSVPEFAGKLSTSERILQSLNAGPQSAKNLLAATEVKRNTFDQAIKRLRDQGKIVHVGDQWGLKYDA